MVDKCAVQKGFRLMTKTTAFVVGAAAILFAAPASAGVVYNTIHPTEQYSATAIGSPAGPLAISFNVASSSTITDIQLAMSAGTPSDGGSVLVYLVPDDGSGPPPTAGMPAGGASFTGKTLIGTILDSSLTLAGMTGAGQSVGIVDLPTSVGVAAGEYWLGFTTTGSGRLAFDTSSYLAGTGTTGQKDFTQIALWGTYGVVTGTGTGTLNPGAGNRVFEAQITTGVATPEPASLAIVGVGLAGLGFLTRRRRS
jgi:hypothetical protein